MPSVPVPKPGAVGDALAPKAPRPNLKAVEAAVVALNTAIDAAFDAGGVFDVWAVTIECGGRCHTHIELDPRGPVRSGERLPGGLHGSEDGEGWQDVDGIRVRTA